MIRRPLVLVGLAVSLLAAWGFWSAAWGAREARRWEGCLGRPLAACTIPEGYALPAYACPAWQRCEIRAPAVRAVSIDFPGAPETLWTSHAFAILSLDARDRIVRVEIERIHVAL